jgi:hypothetical protein
MKLSTPEETERYHEVGRELAAKISDLFVGEDLSIIGIAIGIILAEAELHVGDLTALYHNIDKAKEIHAERIVRNPAHVN